MSITEAPPALPTATTTVTPVAGTVPRRWWGLAAILMATLLNLLDASIVNIALPVIQQDLGGSYAAMQWIVASYTLVLAMGLMTGGRLGDMYGRARMLFVGAGGFLITSVGCALAFSPEAMIGARAAQGLFAAVMIPQCFGLLRDLFPGPDQAKAWAVFGPSIGLATIAGPIVAGALINADLLGAGWRMIFLINLPLGLFALLAGRYALPRTRGTRTGGLDLTGVLLAATGMALLVYPLVQGREQGWPVWIWGMLAAAPAVLTIFALQQRRRTATGRIPLVQLSVFTHRSYTSGVAFVVLFFIAIIGLSLAVGFLLQFGLGFSPIAASIAMAPWAIGAFLGSAAGAMAPHLGRKVLHLGLTIMGTGITAIATALHLTGTGLSAWHLTAPMLIFGLGMGMIFVPLFDIIMGDITDHQIGSASGTLESIQQLASALGVAIMGTIFFNQYTPATPATAATTSLDAAEHITHLALILTAAAFALAFLLPRKARTTH